MTATAQPQASISQARGDKPYPVPRKELFVEVVDGLLPDPELDRIGQYLIEDEPLFEPLQAYEIAFLWKEHGGTSGGKAVLARTTKLAPLAHYLCKVDAAVLLSADHCRDAGASFRVVEAILHHELSHLCPTDDGKLALVSHDVEMFHAELRRYGLWRSDLRQLRQTILQSDMFEGVTS